MFDGLRNDASDTSGFDEKQVEFFPDGKKTAAAPVHRKGSGQLLGMTAQQRFLIAVMLMIMVCTLGAACMLISGSFVF
jgi:hypothetical protein